MLWTTINAFFYCPNLTTLATLYLEIKRFVKVTWLWSNDVAASWGGVTNGTLRIRFTCSLNLMFLASRWLEKCKFFKLVILLTLNSSILTCSYLLTLGRLYLFYWFWARCQAAKDNPNPLTLTNNSRTTHRSGTSHFQELISPVNN